MGTKLGPVDVPLRLDVSEINRQIGELEQRIKIRRPTEESQTADAPARTPVSSTARAESRAASLNQKQLRHQSFVANVSGAVVKRVRGGLSGSPLATRVNNLVGQVQDVLPMEGAKPGIARTVAGGAMKAAAAFGIALETAKVLPMAAAFGSAIGGENTLKTPEGSERTFHEALETLRVRIVELESMVTSIFSGFDKTTKFSRAAERLTGDLPDTMFYQRMFSTYDEQTRQLEAKFKTWKGKEAPWVVLQTFGDLVKRSMSK